MGCFGAQSQITIRLLELNPCKPYWGTDAKNFNSDNGEKVRIYWENEVHSDNILRVSTDRPIHVLHQGFPRNGVEECPLIINFLLNELGLKFNLSDDS